MMVGERIKMARAMAQLTMRELASRAGVSHQAIGKYEKGTATPSSKVLIRLSKALNVGVEFLMRPRTVELSEIKFRKKKSGAKELAAIRAEVRDRIERYMLVERLFPERRKETLRRYELSSDEDAEVKAKQWRRAWCLGLDPIDNLVETAEAHGIKVVILSVPERYDGCAVWIEAEIPCLFLNQNVSECRFRLTLAHEMGHLVAKMPKGWSEKRQESAAFRLGAAFLVPDEVVFDELGHTRRTLDLAELLALKQIYGLSVQAWIKRARQLDVISETAEARLFRDIGRLRWRKTEPGDEPTSERSYRFGRLLLRAVTEQYISTERAEELGGRPLEELRAEMPGYREDAARPDH